MRVLTSSIFLPSFQTNIFPHQDLSTQVEGNYAVGHSSGIDEPNIVKARTWITTEIDEIAPKRQDMIMGYYSCISWLSERNRCSMFLYDFVRALIHFSVPMSMFLSNMMWYVPNGRAI